MSIFLRLGPYFRSQWRMVVLAVLLMGIFALLSGFSLGLILPIVEGVFFREPSGAETPTLAVGEGLRLAREAMGDALSGPGSFQERIEAARKAGEANLRRILDESSPLEILSWLCLLTVAAVLLKNLADFGRKVAFIRVEQGASEGLRNDLFRHVLQLPLATVNRRETGQLLSRIVTDVELVKTLTINTAASFVHNLLQVVVYLVITIWASAKLALVCFLVVPPIMLVTGKLASRLKRQSARAQARIADLTGALGETLGGIKVVKGFGTEPQETERFANHTRDYRRSVVRLLGLDSLAAPLSEFWGVAVGVGVLFYGGQLLLQGDGGMSTGRFFIFFFALISMLHPLKQLSTIVARFQRGAAAAERVFEILDLPAEEDPPDAAPVSSLERDLVFESVSFDYGNGQPVLTNVSFQAPRGTQTALVGPSGAGKSTLIDLIPRFHDPTSGRILLDGVDLRRIRRRDLRALTGIVGQETLLFNTTIFGNIAYGTPGVTRDQVREASVAANALEFIESLPQGFATPVGERGYTLSGGQRQRLAIARALLRNPKILILDEATSSLDSESEAQVQEALDRLLEGRTTFVIAHRLSTVVRADRILVLDRGRIVQDGTHETLVATPGLYRRLCELQFRTEETIPLNAVES